MLWGHSFSDILTQVYEGQTFRQHGLACCHFMAFKSHVFWLRRIPCTTFCVFYIFSEAVCTRQVLSGVIGAGYGVWHGPERKGQKAGLAATFSPSQCYLIWSLLQRGNREAGCCSEHLATVGRRGRMSVIPLVKVALSFLRPSGLTLERNHNRSGWQCWRLLTAHHGTLRDATRADGLLGFPVPSNKMDELDSTGAVVPDFGWPSPRSPSALRQRY